MRTGARIWICWVTRCPSSRSALSRQTTLSDQQCLSKLSKYRLDIQQHIFKLELEPDWSGLISEAENWPWVCDGDEQRLYKHGAEEGGGGQDVGWGLQKLLERRGLTNWRNQEKKDLKILKIYVQFEDAQTQTSHSLTRTNLLYTESEYVGV